MSAPEPPALRTVLRYEAQRPAGITAGRFFGGGSNSQTFGNLLLAVQFSRCMYVKGVPPDSSVHLASMDAKTGKIEEGTQKIKTMKPLIHKDYRGSLRYNKHS